MAIDMTKAPIPKGEPRRTRKGRQRRQEGAVKKSVRQCKQCAKTFVLEPHRLGKFCRLACYWEHQRARVTLACGACQKPIQRRANEIRRKKNHFCSPECSRRYHVGIKSASWRGGSKKSRGARWNHIAATVRVRDDFKCRWCGIPQSENGGPALSVDHVRPWRECESEAEANAMDNLVSLCRWCHGKKTRLENKWLRGDGLALQEYRRLVGVTPVAAVDPVPPTTGLGPPRVLPDYSARAAAISAAKLRFYAQPGARERASQISKASMTPEVKARLSAKAFAQWSDPDTRERMCEGMRRANR